MWETWTGLTMLLGLVAVHFGLQWLQRVEARRKNSEVASLAELFTRTQLVAQFEECKRQAVNDPTHLGKYTARIELLNLALEHQARAAQNLHS